MQISGSNKCGHPYGSISGIQVTHGEIFSWYDSNGIVVGQAPDVDKLAAGAYSLLISNHYNCSSGLFNIVVPAIPNPDLTSPQSDNKMGFCGISNGYIHPLGIQHADQYSFRWTDVSAPNVSISQTLNLDNILSGNFNLYATDKNGCEESAGQFGLTSSPTPVINEQNKVIVDAVCGDNSGLISGLTFTGGTTPFTETWKDGAGEIIQH